jgi:fatty acid desaturase
MGGPPARWVHRTRDKEVNPRMVIDLGNTTFWAAVLAIIVGVLILIVPRLLNYLVALYLIVIGVLGLLPFLGVTAA